MAQTRREFMVHTTAAGIGAAAVLGVPGVVRAALAGPGGQGRAEKPMKILFLGGTGMLGPHTVRMLVERGHEVTLFNRGNRDELFPDLEFIQGNRIVDVEPGLTPLKEAIDAGRTWDAVIDTSSVHTWTENSAKLLKDAAERYVFTSSLSVYADNSKAGLDESDTVATMPDEIADSIDRLPYDMTFFGAVKARCEDAAERHFPGRALVLRPGLLVGPRDFTHRFTYWPNRVREGGKVLAAGEPQHPLQFIDVRDLARFMVHTIERKAAGIYNVNGPVGGGMTMGKMLEACKEATGSDASFVWADGQWLAERGVNAWAQMPVWIPPGPQTDGFHQRSIEKATKAGLTTRPLEDTVRDTLAWFDDEYLPQWKQRAEEGGQMDPAFSFGGGRLPGITRARESALLEDWQRHLEAEGSEG